jgi:hypothetical protein
MNNQEIANVTTEVAVAQNEMPNLAALMEMSHKVEKLKPTFTLTSEYIELQKPSESFKGIYAGITEMQVSDKNTGELKTLACARFLINGKVYINGGAVLLSEIRRAALVVGTAVQVTFTKKEGNTKIYELALLG